ncbi:MAG: DUF2309 domain-containing protein [Gammaproteobacteria bacterium]|nr:DUF2309 domain-containing protein [Gammaproteobacteria bacterium]
MALTLGRKLGIRSMVYVAGKPIPFFWPMRSFIHHNPLHGLENLPFDEAVVKAHKLFHANTYLPRTTYQNYWQQGKVCQQTLHASTAKLAQELNNDLGVDLEQWFANLMLNTVEPVTSNKGGFSAEAVWRVLQGADHKSADVVHELDLPDILNRKLSADRPLYESIDLLFDTGIGEELDELVIKSCLDFFDEGQSVWKMPGRRKGLFQAWYQMASRNRWLSRRARFIHALVDDADSPEDVIDAVMRRFQVPEAAWQSYFTYELSRLHGWVGFIRWRENSKNYYWRVRYPADLVDYLAVRLTLSAALLQERARKIGLLTVPAMQDAIQSRTIELFLRQELYSGEVFPPLAQQVESSIALNRARSMEKFCIEYLRRKSVYEAEQCARRLQALAKQSDDTAALKTLSLEQVTDLLHALRSFEKREGQLWLEAMEQQSMDNLLQDICGGDDKDREKRPFAQALFCIDTRSERIRRHLESVGDYQTYGIAGFFGVPFSFMELGKGSETHLCPILLTPKNLVLEISRDETVMDEAALSALEKAIHELKESIFSPFVTVEAIGLLFGFDMFGKTLAPRTYHGLRKHLHQHKPITYLLQDKLSREQADSVVRAVQRALIENAVELDLGIPKERITDDMVRQLRECALEHESDAPLVREELHMKSGDLEEFVNRLRQTYQINPPFARLQLERLGRIGFSLDEQVNFVSTALRSIGLTTQFSRFVLLMGHGSRSENNPYESALDCGACGGNHGLFNARVLAYMANKPQVRAKLKQQGLPIADDVWFIPAMHNTTTDEMNLYDLELLPSSHLIYLDRLRNGLIAASRLCAKERLLTLDEHTEVEEPAAAFIEVQRNAMDWSQVRPEWGLSRNVYFIIGRRRLTRNANLEGRSFLHSYDYREDPNCRLLANILGGPLVVGQWINMEHYFSTVDNERLGSGSKVYHNVAGRFGVMTGNLSDLRTGLPAQTVLNRGTPYHEPLRLITVIEGPYATTIKAIEEVAAVSRLVRNHWIRLMIIDPETGLVHSYEKGEWTQQALDKDQTVNASVEECA